MFTKINIVALALTTLILAGCGIRSYRPDELGSLGIEASHCAITRVDGVMARDGVLMFSHHDMQQYLSQLAKYKLPMPSVLPAGSRVQLISLSSSWDSTIGWHIEAKAEVNGHVYKFMTGHGTNYYPTMSDFTEFIENTFSSCRE